MKVALFGIHKLLSDSLAVLEEQQILPRVVIFPPFKSQFHKICENICERNNIPFLRPESVKDPEFIRRLQNFAINRIIVAGYHQIFPAKLLILANMGALNCHGGLLPEERGPIPWKWAVYNNRSFSGITIHQMTDKVDQGKIYYKEKIILSEGETSESLFNKISLNISRCLPLFLKLTELSEFIEEDPKVKVGYNGQVPEELCQFDLLQNVLELDRRVRAFSPRPGVIFQMGGGKILVKKVKAISDSLHNGKWVFDAADGRIEINEYETV